MARIAEEATGSDKTATRAQVVTRRKSTKTHGLVLRAKDSAAKFRRQKDAVVTAHSGVLVVKITWSITLILSEPPLIVRHLVHLSELTGGFVLKAGYGHDMTVSGMCVTTVNTLAEGFLSGQHAQLPFLERSPHAVKPTPQNHPPRDVPIKSSGGYTLIRLAGRRRSTLNSRKK